MSISGEIIGGITGTVSMTLFILKILFFVVVGILIGGAIYLLIWKILAEMKMRKLQKQFEKDLEVINGNK